MSKSSFEDYLNDVSSGQSKLASLGSTAGGGILAKLAAELDGAGAPVAEGQVTPANAPITGAAPATVAATEGVAAPQLALAGADPQEAVQGEAAAPTKPNQGVVISAGDGTQTDANNLNKTPKAVAVAAGPGDSTAAPASAPATEEEKTAAYLGEVIADSFLDSLIKQAEEGEYAQSLGILKEAGLLDGYDIVDDAMDKTAGQYDYDEELGLEKIANSEVLSHQDIINAASEVLELEAYEQEKVAELSEYEDELIDGYFMAKEAGDFESALSIAEDIVSLYGDEEAIKVAEDLGNDLDETADAFIKQAELEEEVEKIAEFEQAEALSGNPDVMAAVATLRQHGVL